MRAIAGIIYPCFDCRERHKCRQKSKIHKQVFFAIGNGKPVTCGEYKEDSWHGVEGVPA